MKINLNNAEFIKSAASKSDFIQTGVPKIIFAGKSNVGKSSVINRVLNRKNFARVGSEPGKTIHVNYFLIDKKAYLIDLPGYGYAKVSPNEKIRWAKLLESFFSVASDNSLGIMIVDARHKPTADDITMSAYFRNCGRPFIVLANKVDKLKKSEIAENMKTIKETLSLTDDIKLISFSAENGTGKAELLSEIDNFL